MNEHDLQHMYQAWQQGIDDYVHRYIEFLEMAARYYNTSAADVMKILQTTWWFERGEQ